MKTIQKQAIVTVLIAAVTLTVANAQIGQDFEQQIERIVAEPLRVYQLSPTENAKVFRTIDTFFHQNLGLNKAKQIRGKNLQTSTRTRRLPTNLLLLTEGIKKVDTGTKESVSIWYETGPQERRFRKDLSKPVLASVPSDEITQQAQRFITQNNFCRITARDKIVDSQVVARKMKRFREKDEADETLTVLQRAIFKRQFNGLRVINSKQVVDIHPQTREILAYKSLKWTPVDATSGKLYPYLSKEKIIAHIDEVLGVSQKRNKIERLGSAYLQTDKLLIPVLLVEAEPVDVAVQHRPSEKRTLLVSLAQNLPKPEEDTKLRSPKKAP
jgi:transposase-like protein